jgi:hypothetical protein
MTPLLLTLASLTPRRRRAGRLKAPFSGPAFTALELVPGALAGVTGEARYPPPFGLE